MEKIKIQNITWNFDKVSEDFLQLGIGYANMGIPQNMLKRFIRECGWEAYRSWNDKKAVPHYDDYMTEDALEQAKQDSEHECYNSDTQIVLMKWLHNKRRNYTLSYQGEDPFWLFHDNRHSKWDVYSDEVSNITAHTEYQRILEGVEMARDHGVLIQPKTAVGILNAWQPRFGAHAHQISERDFWPFFQGEREEEFEMELIYHS